MIILLIITSLFNFVVFASDLFHVNSKTTFSPDEASEYFGYSVLLTKKGLIVGAPKAESRVKNGSFPGNVFTCLLDNLNKSNITCNPLERHKKQYLLSGYFKNDMWFGATIAEMPDGTLLACAPRRMTLDNRINDGACYVHGKNADVILSPLDWSQIFYSNNEIPQKKRKDYANYNSGAEMLSRNRYHIYGQAGMAVTYAKDNSVLIGAPGVLEWTGSIFDYKYNPSSFTFDLSPSPNPYFTMELGPDDYLGYSVESGFFDENGIVLYVAGAPRSKHNLGQVLIFEKPVRTLDPLKIRKKLIGPHMGSYFGASLSTPDLNMDGISDLLVGAPNYAVRTDVPSYDQGAVYVYITRKADSGFTLEETNIIRGSSNSGARFGTSIADLGDIDGDGFIDIAIGAPWENEGAGVVYIYKGSANGLMSQYIQRIITDSASGFGMSISKGFDVDNNGCNDLAIGAYDSSTAYIYRSIPTMQVMTSIEVPGLKKLKKDASNFTALFCVSVPLKKSWPNADIRLIAKVTVDPDGNRAKIKGKSDYTIITKAGSNVCTPQIIEVNNQSDFSRPILIKFEANPVDLDTSPKFPLDSSRLSEDSKIETSYLIQLLSECGDDLVCKPWLVMNLEPLKREFVPGLDHELGIKITVTNIEEPAFSVKLHVAMPYPPKRLLDSCSLQNLDLICDLPAPLSRNQTVEWVIQLEYSWDGSDKELMIAADLKDPLYMRNISNEVDQLVIPIVPQVSYSFTGIAQFNSTVYITRSTLEKGEDVLFSHYYVIINHGPSDIYNMKVEFIVSKEIIPASLVDGSSFRENKITFRSTNLKVNRTTGYILPLQFNLTYHADTLKSLEVMNVSSRMFLYVQYGSTIENRTIEVTTHLVLEPTIPIWPLIVASLTGLVILAVIILGMYKFGFFSRPKKEDLAQLIENNYYSSQEIPRESSIADDISIQDITP